MVNIKLTDEQKKEMEDNINHLSLTRNVITSLYDQNQETFLLNTLTSLNDDLYMLKTELDELNKKFENDKEE